ncbi:hypothetical protein ACI2KR_30395 [Pseudomonas luteola]
MQELINYIQENSVVSLASIENGVDMAFMFVKAGPDVTAQSLRSALASALSEPEAPDLFDGHEHSYIELGAWLDSQSVALMLMGMGEDVGLWKCYTPSTVLKIDNRSDQGKMLAAKGLVTIRA